MGWMPGIPHDEGVLHGAYTPQAIVLHRTYGAWGGDYSVGKQGIFHFLIGKAEGRWVQFAPTDDMQWHCNGANRKAVGIEIEGTNEDDLTDWQTARLGDILDFCHAEHGIPLDYLDPNSVPPASVWVNGGTFSGVISHVSVKTDDGSSQHTDEIEPAAFRAAVNPHHDKPEPAPLRSAPDMYLISDPQKKADKYVVGAEGARHIKSTDEYNWLRGPLPFGGGLQEVPNVSQGWFDSLPKLG